MGLSEFHYVRTRGDDGGVDACEGPAIGLDLETVLKDGLPPWNVALEVVAALCEILDIADEDGEIHGDVHPKYVFIDETGAVSLEGFGVKRRKVRAPEGAPKDTRTDLYGLGHTAYRTFCARPLPDVVPTDASAHDEMVVDAALAIDLSGVPEAMQGDIQWYVAKLMEFDPSERPKALDAWRTFVAFASATPGVDMAEWCAAALDGGGVRRTVGAAPAAAPAPQGARPVAAGGSTNDEDLGGPSVQKGPLGSKVAFEDPAAGTPAKGATAFWSRDSIKKALDEAEEKAAPVGGGNATAFWTPDQLDAMQRGADDAPRPRRAEGEGERRRTTSNQRPGAEKPTTTGAPAPRPRAEAPAFVPPPDASYHGPLETPSEGIPSPSTGPLTPVKTQAPPPSPPPVAAPPPRSPPPESVFVPGPGAPPAPPSPAPAPGRTLNPAAPAAPAAGAASPPPPPVAVATPKARPEPRPAEPEPEPEAQPGGGGGIGFVLFGGGVAAAALAGGAVVLLAVLVLVLVVALPAPDRTPPSLPAPDLAQPVAVVPAPDPSAPPPVPGSTPATEPAPVPDPALPTGDGDPPAPAPAAPSAPKPAPSPKPSPKPGPAPKPPPKPSPAPVSPAPAPAPRPTPAPAPSRPRPTSTTDARVNIRSGTSGAVSGCVRTKIEFSGTRAFTIEAYQLPATCLVTIEGAKGVFQVYASGDVTCNKQGTVVLCDKSEVR